MGGSPRERLGWKEPLHSLRVELERDYGLSVIESRALEQRVGEFVDTYVSQDPEAKSHGQVWYQAVKLGERAGKPVRYCQTVSVSLTLIHPSDAEILEANGSPALRRVRLVRLCGEAYRQGGVLSHEDLSLLLAVDTSTIRRLVKQCKAAGERPMTRGIADDIGPAVSHKERVIQLCFRGFLAAGIATRTGHSLGSVERYLTDFSRVVALSRQQVSTETICRLTSLSMPVVTRYLKLAKQYDQPEHQCVLDRLLLRFGPLEADHG